MDVLEAFNKLEELYSQDNCKNESIKLKESWEEIHLDRIVEEDPDRVITVVIKDRRFEPLFNRRQSESIERNNLRTVGHFLNGTVIKGQAKNIAKLCDDCCIAPPHEQFINDTL